MQLAHVTCARSDYNWLITVPDYVFKQAGVLLWSKALPCLNVLTTDSENNQDEELGVNADSVINYWSFSNLNRT